MIPNPFLEMSDPEPRLMDLFAWRSAGGIFTAMQSKASSMGGLPWDVNAVDLDYLYFGNHSGSKYCAPLVKALMVDGSISDASRLTLAGVILSKYLGNWRRLWNTYVAEYDPLDNFHIRNERSFMSASGEASETNSHDESEDETTYGLKQTTTYGKKQENDTDTFGFNSATGAPRDHQEIQDSGNDSTQNSGKDGNEGSRDSTGEGNRFLTGEEEERVYKYGNVGTFTSQRLITEERSLWRENYFEQVFKDLDKLLVLMVHDPCRV